jgi:hypothetical protein
VNRSSSCLVWRPSPSLTTARPRKLIGVGPARVDKSELLRDVLRPVSCVWHPRPTPTARRRNCTKRRCSGFHQSWRPRIAPVRSFASASWRSSWSSRRTPPSSVSDTPSGVPPRTARATGTRRRERRCRRHRRLCASSRQGSADQISSQRGRPGPVSHRSGTRPPCTTDQQVAVSADGRAVRVGGDTTS